MIVSRSRKQARHPASSYLSDGRLCEYVDVACDHWAYLVSLKHSRSDRDSFIVIALIFA